MPPRELLRFLDAAEPRLFDYVDELETLTDDELPLLPSGWPLPGAGSRELGKDESR